MRIIAGEARGRVIEAPPGRHTRPTLDRVRENLFNMIQANVPGSRLLDLFAGSGALSLEALSRGAAFAVLADNDRNASETQKRNISLLRYQDRARQFRCDWRAAVEELRKEREVFDLVFLDPPYSMQDMREVFLSLIPLAGKDTLFILEHEAGRNPEVPDRFTVIRDRSWGFCAVTIYQLSEEGV
ncbi:MAG: 16S rRNA (guanine(966)-N(2))-methyltransferase RsmD [Clostridia bacterium]|nr:16S rRNA (guanine(966)-N(2))-methyltransferase RsmD [Clostridia bacterium]